MPIAPSPTTATRPLHVFIAGALLVLAAFAAYHNSFSGPLIYDDVPAIKDNPTIKNLWALSEVLSPPNDSGITVNGRPLVNLSLAINYALGGTEVFGYHVFNLLIHVCAGLALFGLVRRSLQLPALRERFGGGDHGLLAALAVALLWTLHPLQTESVTYIIQRAESLVGLFYLLTFYCFIRSVTSPRPALWQTLTVLACLGGMACKEVMASAPLLVLLYDRAVVSGTFRDAWRRHARLYLGLAATWLPLAWLVHSTHGRGGTAGFGAGDMSSWHYALTSALALVKYLKLAFWPDPLVFDYGVAVEKHLLPVLPQALLIVALVGATFYALWHRPLLGFIGLWFFAILGPSSSFIPVATETMAEHRMYLPLAAVLALVVLGVVGRLGRGAAFGFLALAVGAGALTERRNEDYRDELLLWRDAQRKYPTNARAHNNVGEILFRTEKQEEAVACFREAVRLLPNYIDALNNLGNTLSQLGHSAEALPHLELALRLKPGYAETYNNLGNACYQLGRKEEAVANYRESLRCKPAFADAHNNLGVVLGELGRPAEAIPHYVEALRLRQNYTDAHYNYGNALNQTGRPAEAVVQYRETLRLNPAHAKAHHNLGGILLQQGKIAEAQRHFEEAIRLKPDYPDALNSLGVTLFQSGRTAEARPYFESALRYQPDFPPSKNNLADVHNNLGAAAVSAGRLSEAREDFAAVLRLNPNHAGAHNNLAVVLWRLGDTAQALAHFEEAVRLNPDFRDAQDSLATLRKQLATGK